MTQLRLVGVTKRYGGYFGGSDQGGVRDVNLTVPNGKVLALFGPSGSGKTTLLRLIAGLERCDRGQIWLGDRDVTVAAPHTRAVSMVAQHPALFPHLTVLANLAFGLSNSNASGVFDVVRRVLRVSWWRDLPRHAPETSVRAERLQQVIRSLRLTELLGRFPHQLSGGERQRVALGRAIVREPAVFLFDEPMSAIDAQHRWQVRSGLLQLLRRESCDGQNSGEGNCGGASSVYVTHDFVEAMVLADQVAILIDGQVRQVGPPLEVYRRPDFLEVGRLFGPHGINELPVRWSDGWRNGRFALPVGLQGGARRAVPDGVTIGVRPVCVEICSERQRGDAAWSEAELQGEVVEFEELGSEQWVGVDLERSQFDPGIGNNGLPGLWWIPVPLAKSNRDSSWGGRDSMCGGEGRREVFRVGDRVRLRLPAEQLQFFDATSGQNLGKEFNEAQ
ncbi:MAG: ABC transporter ATP-binding protein [Planctomycetaceae bacterium]|jgi:multiple sugar transport system ATP-binding protein|nr:ABC transporter ATP-binding protein [Planctomycetaceae bacterium]